MFVLEVVSTGQQAQLLPMLLMSAWLMSSFCFFPVDFWENLAQEINRHRCGEWTGKDKQVEKADP
jgi:hypothetical protein